MPQFSIIVPTRNRRDFLARTLDSVFAQRFDGRVEIIVVDDGSSDGTAEYLASLGGRVKSLRLDGRGPGSARNAGAHAATARYLAFLDSDDLWFPWTLSTLASVIERHGQPAYVCGSFIQFSDEQALKDCREVPVEADAFTDYFSSWPNHPVVGASMIVVDRETFAAAGGFAAQNINLEDHDLSLKLGAASGFVQVRQPLTMAWRLHPGGVTNDLDKSLAGCLHLIASEREGRYPGGAARAGVRRAFITTHARSLSLEFLKRGRLREAFQIYFATLGWHLSLGRYKYAFAFPVWAVLASLRHRDA